MAADIECLKWNKSNFKLSNGNFFLNLNLNGYLLPICFELFLVFDYSNFTLVLKPSLWLSLKTKGHSIKVSYLGQTSRLASLDNLNNFYVYDWSQVDIKSIK